MITQVIRYILPNIFVTMSYPSETIDPKTVDPHKGTVWVEPTPELIAGEIQEAAKVNGTQPVRVIGVSQYRKGEERSADDKAKPGERILYYLHGKQYNLIVGGYMKD